MEQNGNIAGSRQAGASHPFLRAWNSVGLVILKYWIIGLGILSYVGAAFLPALFDPLYKPVEQPWSVLGENFLGLTSILGTGALLFFGAKDVEELFRLRSQNGDLRRLVDGFGNDLFDVWHMQLSQWSRELEFSGDERISLYKYSEDRFIMLGRYSENRQFSTKGRGVYPSDQGCIGRAWRSGDGYAGVDGLPDPAADPVIYKEAQQELCDMPPDVVGDLRMKPRSIAAFTIMDETGTRRAAIIVFESTNPNKLSALGLGNFLRGARERQVTLLMAAMKNHEPSLELAAREGF